MNDDGNDVHIVVHFTKECCHAEAGVAAAGSFNL